MARLGAIALAALLAGCASTLRPERRGGRWFFKLPASPEARKAYVTGSFADWNPRAEGMSLMGDGTFLAALSLPAGRHTYAFVIELPNGALRFLTPPDAPEYEEDEFGGKNGVLWER